MKKIWCDYHKCKELISGEYVNIFGWDYCEQHGLELKNTIKHWTFGKDSVKKDQHTGEPSSNEPTCDGGDCDSCQCG